MLTTTYKHDYVSPQTKRYEFLKPHFPTRDGEGDGAEEQCQCIEEPQIQPPKAVLDKCPEIEWTGIAPLGRLIDPRIIPTKLSPEQTKLMAHELGKDCYEMQPNRFLKILRTAYPDLYERLKEMPKDELNRRMDNDRMYTTYQIDYCNMNEYPEGVYQSLKQEDDPSKINARQLLKRENHCAEFRANVMSDLEKENDAGYIYETDPCEKIYKPFKVSFADSTRFISSGNNSHWRSAEFTKRARFSEYMDSISRNGCVIIRNNLHDHSKCAKGKHCTHKLNDPCTSF